MIHFRASVPKSNGPNENILEVVVKEDPKGACELTVRQFDGIMVKSISTSDFAFDRKKCNNIDLVFVSLCAFLGEERCNELLKKHKKYFTKVKTKKPKPIVDEPKTFIKRSKT